MDRPDPIPLSDSPMSRLSRRLRCDRLTVLVNDPQRDTDSGTVLGWIGQIRRPAEVRILVAAGSHAFDDARRLAFEARLLEALPCDRIAWHDARAEGLAPVGAIWQAHPWLLEADRDVVAIGSVEPHYFAGYSGAHKTATIGVARRRDIELNHAMALSADCQPGRLHGNPVHDGIIRMLDELEGVRPVHAVNLVQQAGRILGSFVGDPLESLEAAARLAERTFITRLQRHADALVARVDGALAASFYQADKGIKNNEWAVRAGGVLVLEAPCPDGIGQDSFLDLLRYCRSVDEVLRSIERRGYRLGDHKAVRLRYLTDPMARNIKLFVVSEGLTEDDAFLLGAHKAASVEEALSRARIQADRCHVVEVSDAGNRCTLPPDSSLRASDG